MRIEANECDKTKTWAGTNGLKHNEWNQPSTQPKMGVYGGQWSSKGTKHTKGEKVDENRFWGYLDEKSSLRPKHLLD